MSIITLTSDVGDNNHYAASLKGVILSLYPNARMVDITHNIPDFDIMEAAYILKSSFWAFPVGTIHLIAVDPERGNRDTGIVVKYKDHYFVCPDNGVMSLICDGSKDYECVCIENEGLFRRDFPRSFRSARIFAPAAAFLASGGTLEEVGSAAQMKELKWGEPSYSDNCLRGKIIHIDKFGNAITNIRKGSFLSIKDDRAFEIFIRNVRLKRIVSTYSDVGKADALAIFGEGEHLEIAMREAPAAALLGLKVHDMITIEFRPQND